MILFTFHLVMICGCISSSRSPTLLISTATRFMASKLPNEEEDESPPYPYLQNQYHPYGDYSLKILLSFSSIYKATKCLLQKVCFVFNFLRPRKTADPLLPIQNPSSTALCQPLLVPTPLICASILENAFEAQTDLDGIDVEEAQSENECHVLCCQEWKEESYLAERNEIDRGLVVSTPMIRCSNGVEENVRVKKKKTKTKKKGVKEEEVDEKERRLKHYSSRHKILLVGEGDFSFSACLAMAFVSAPNIIATSLNSTAFLKKHYGKAMSNIDELRSRGSQVMHGIDATEIANHELLRQLKYDRIIFNFPFAGFFHNLSTQDQLSRHRKLVSLFLKNAGEMISENGEIHISHKTNGFHADFNLESIASLHGLKLIQAVKFNLSHYPGYDTKFGFGGDGNFNCYPSKTFKFGLKSTAPVL